MIGTLENLKAYLKITGSDDDSVLENCLRASSDFIESFCGRKFEKETFTEFFDGDDGDSVFVKNLPIAFPNYGSDSFLKINDEVVSEDDFGFYDHGKVFLKYGTFKAGRKNIEVKYQGGFDVDSLPSDLVQACLILAGQIFNREKSAGISSESLGDISVSYETSKIGTPLVRSVLSKYSIVL